METLSSRYNPRDLLKDYRLDVEAIHIATIASHSALDVFDGAKDEGFKTIAVCQKGREKPYLRFRRVVDYPLILYSFADVVKNDVVSILRSRNSIFIPNRSFAVYVGYDNIEQNFPIPIFGNRYLLRYEERVGIKTYYKLLDEAGIRRPRTYSNPDEIDRPVIVKMPHAKKRVERGFFVAVDRDDFWKKFRKLISDGVVSENDLVKASIEELIIGAHFNVNYFRSIARKDVEVISIDRRIQTNLDGVLRLPADVQLELREIVDIEMIEIGHEMATIRESMLEKLFEIGDRFVDATIKLEPPGIIGPFTLQLMVTPDLDVVVFDVATRIGGGTNVHMGIGGQYSKLYFGKPISMGRRIAIEIKDCLYMGCIEEIVT
ncbi:MAG: formate--phosphoribosylaminoimidazolecarboxamide ligase family protein [Desulfurococcaceae archaeon]|nr:formate--phosphoribosylaminoimidazolecarboxamide ligase family protein [Desulfurococcaceae archaeon]MCC6057416.1 formate--phosphoribosylaminoimidazolecarboxamide ligase family protein [Desulfurococcaceae archaeon]